MIKFVFLEHDSMDFDPTNSLKRCNSTPIINQASNKAPASPSASIPANVVNSIANITNITISSTTSRSRYTFDLTFVNS